MRTPEGYRRDWCIGKTGCGKSTLLQAIADSFQARGGYVVALDIKEELPEPWRGERIRPDAETMDWGSQGPFFDWCNAWAADVIDRAKEGAFPHGVLLLCDEADTFIRGGKAPPALQRVVMQGRTLGISYAFGVRRPVEIPTGIRTQVQDIYAFRLTDAADVDWLLKHVGEPLPELKGLPVGHFYHVRDGERPHLHTSPFTPCAGNDASTTTRETAPDAQA